jgi:hypothetical protein
MPTYQFFLHTTGISVHMGDGEAPAIGFYTSRRAKAADSEAAFQIVMSAMEADPETEAVLRSGLGKGLRPETMVEEAYVVPWWLAILPWRKPGLAFYQDDPEEGAEDADPPPLP